MASSWTSTDTNYVTVTGTEPMTTTRVTTPWKAGAYTSTSSSWTLSSITTTAIGGCVGLSNTATFGAFDDSEKFESKMLYGWWRSAAGNVWSYLSESSVEGTAVGTTAKLIFNGSTIEYYMDDVLKFTESSPAVTTGLFACSMVYSGSVSGTAESGGASAGGTILPPPIAWVNI